MECETCIVSPPLLLDQPACEGNAGIPGQLRKKSFGARQYHPL
jgi:hypothetical protein